MAPADLKCNGISALVIHCSKNFILFVKLQHFLSAVVDDFCGYIDLFQIDQFPFFLPSSASSMYAFDTETSPTFAQREIGSVQLERAICTLYSIGEDLKATKERGK